MELMLKIKMQNGESITINPAYIVSAKKSSHKLKDKNGFVVPYVKITIQTVKQDHDFIYCDIAKEWDGLIDLDSFVLIDELLF